MNRHLLDNAGGELRRLLCLLTGIALALAAPARGQEADPGTEPPPEESKPKLSRREEARQKKLAERRRREEEERRRAEEARRREEEERREREYARSKVVEDKAARRKAKTMAREREIQDAEKRKEAERVARERGEEPVEDRAAALPADEDELRRRAMIMAAAVSLPPDMPLDYVWSIPLDKPVTEEQIWILRDVILFVVDRTVLYCIRKGDGVPVWAINLGGEPQFKPVVTDRMIYVFIENRLVAIDRMRGEIRWRVSPEFAASSGPCAAEPTLYIPSWDKRVYAVQVRSVERALYGAGTEDALNVTDYEFRPIWHRTAGDHVTGTPVLAEGLLYFGAEDGYVYSFSNDGANRCRIQTQGPIRAPVTVKGAHVYAGSSDYNAYALDRLTLRPAWVFPTGSHVLRPIYADIPSGVAMVTSQRNGIYGVFDRDTAERGSEVWHIPDGKYVAGVSPERAYLMMTDHRLAAIDKKTGIVRWIALREGVAMVAPSMNDWTKPKERFRLICITESGHLACLKEPSAHLERALMRKR